MEKLASINVTRWVNESQAFVEVGTLFRDDSLGRKNPLIGFDYHPEYLENHCRLLPSGIEKAEYGQTLLGGRENKEMVPSYFKQFLPSERNKSVVNSLSGEFHKFDQFQQLAHITKYRGVFGAVQLNYDNETQSNRLPSLEEAVALLETINKGEFSRIDNQALSAMYHPNSETHVVSTFIELNDHHHYCTLRKCADNLEANKLLFIQNMMSECGIDSAFTLKLEGDDGAVYVGQTTGEQIINKNNNTAAMFNTVPASVLLADSKSISSFETHNFAHIHHVASEAIDGVGTEVFKRALFTHLMAQKELSSQHMKFREIKGNQWTLAPQEVCPINLDKNTPFSLPISDTISSYSHVVVNDSLIEMAAGKYSLEREQVEKAVVEIANGLTKINEVAFEAGLSAKDVADLKKSIHDSEVRNYVQESDLNNDKSRGPEL